MAFDPQSYWRERMTRHPDLVGTGTSFMPLAWQRWLYRAKERALARARAATGLAVAGARVLDFGCGTGFFEGLWEREGARFVAGIDIVPELVDRLARAHPQRRYLCADLAATPDAAIGLGLFDVVTAFDVLYHVVDDTAADRVVGALLARVDAGGAFVLTDGFSDARPKPHVRFRSRSWWEAAIARRGFALVHAAPVAVAHNRPSPFGRVLPTVVGAAQYYADRVLLRAIPWAANNWLAIARRR